MSDCADMTTALARELTQGIRNEVEDLSAVFKKMAILKPEAGRETNLWCLSPEVTECDDSTLTNGADAAVSIFYDPPKNIQSSDGVLQRFRQFKATFNPSGVPNVVLLGMIESMLKAESAVPAAGIPDDFDPFAEQEAA
jgi:hypothetical protein